MPILLRCCGFLLLTVASLSPAAAQSVDWPTYGFEPGRSSYNPQELVLNPQSVTQLQVQWSADLGAAITSQPIVVHNAVLSGVPTELVYIGAANGVFEAFNATTGAPIWNRQLQVQHVNCDQQPNGMYGIAGTPVHDPTTHLIYVADGAGLLYALDDATGQTAAGWPIQVLPDPTHEFVWGALSLVNGRILVEDASYCDIGPYTGFVFSIDPVARQIVDTFAVTKIGDGGGIWGYGGASVDPTTQAIYVATGNGLSSETSGFSEDVIRLDPSLNLVAANYAGFVGNDVDYGATPFLYSTACNNQVAAINKSGVLATYDRDNIDAGPLQKLQISAGGGLLIGDFAEDPTAGLFYVASADNSPSGPYNHGLLAFAVNGSCQLQLAWQTPIGINRDGPMASPTAIAGVVFDATGPGNTLYALNSSTGAELWSSSVFRGPVFVAPAVVGGQIFIGSWDDHLYAFGVPPTPLLASVLPDARSVALGNPATVFATMFNTGNSTLNGCQVALPASAPSGLALTYQTTNPTTNLPIGQPNQPVSIAAGGGQSFVLAFDSSNALALSGQGLVFTCDGTTNAASIPGVDDLDLTFSSTPVADIVALSATESGNGIVQIPFSQGLAGAFAVASINVGISGGLTVSADLDGAALPITLLVCQTNPSNAQCLAPPAPSVPIMIAAGATPTFSVFATASGSVPFAPAASRVFLRFTDSNGMQHGSTSVAVATD
jgi:outer membrane protein assembly factor BamB